MRRLTHENREKNKKLHMHNAVRAAHTEIQRREANYFICDINASLSGILRLAGFCTAARNEFNLLCHQENSGVQYLKQVINGLTMP